MSGLGNHQMIRKYRIWIYKNIIFLAFAAFESEHYLLRRTILPAKETSALRKIFLAELGCGRNHSGRIELKLDCKATYFHFPDLHVFKGTEITAGKRPLRQLVPNKFMYSVLSHEVF